MNFKSISDEEKIYENVNGFFHGSILAVSTRNYGGKEINLYADSTENSNIVVTINKEVQLTLKNANSTGKWIKINWNSNGNHVIAWIKKDWLCGSIRTNCS